MTLACAGTLLADVLPESMRVYPTPREVTLTNTVCETPKSIAFSPANFDPASKAVLAKQFKIEKQAKFVITWTNTPSVNDALHQQGYTLELTPNGAHITAHTDTGLFYAAQTLRQLLASDKYTTLTMNDWPAVPFRGTVEGFYGQPWSFEARKSQFRFYGKWKLNAYIYGPKDDPFHGFSKRWREPYPPAEAKRLAELVKVAHQNKVNFVWAVHPGRDIHWNTDADIKACVKKFEHMYALGVRSFAVFFDDIGGEGARAEKQVELLNYVNRNFVHTHKEVNPLLLCPTQYNQAWSQGNYLDILGKGLDPDIMVMWTGRSVCTDITKESMEWINKRLGRKAYIWWNWPVSDYCRSNLLMGKAYGNSRENGPLYAGFVSNPMDKPEASKIPLFGVADYTWNPEAYDADRAWADSFARVFPKQADALHTFAMHNADQGQNVHKYRREESENIKAPLLKAAEAISQGQAPAAEDAKAITEEFARIEASGKALREDKANALLYTDIADWADLFARLGTTGVALNEAIAGKVPAETALKTLLAYRADHAAISARHAAKPFQTPIDTGTLLLTPYVNLCGASLYNKLWMDTTGKPAPKNATQAYEFITNVDSLRTLVPTRQGPYVMLPKIHEPKVLQPGQWVGLRLPQGLNATWVHFILDAKDAHTRGRVQLSRDGGKTWGERAIVARAGGKDGEMEVRHIKETDGINAARYINISGEPITITFKLFKLDVPKDATANIVASMTDGDLNSSYTLPAGATITVPLSAPVTAENTKVLAIGDVKVTYTATGIRLTAGFKKAKVYEIIH